MNFIKFYQCQVHCSCLLNLTQCSLKHKTNKTYRFVKITLILASLTHAGKNICKLIVWIFLLTLLLRIKLNYINTWSSCLIKKQLYKPWSLKNTFFTFRIKYVCYKLDDFLQFDIQIRRFLTIWHSYLIKQPTPNLNVTRNGHRLGKLPFLNVSWSF